MVVKVGQSPHHEKLVLVIKATKRFSGFFLRSLRQECQGQSSINTFQSFLFSFETRIPPNSLLTSLTQIKHLIIISPLHLLQQVDDIRVYITKQAAFKF